MINVQMHLIDVHSQNVNWICWIDAIGLISCALV
jgi:hypothetical protein